MSLIISAPAKLNISLDVIKKTASGWHEIETVLIECPQIRDEIEILRTEEKDETSIVQTDKNIAKIRIPKTEENLCHKTLTLLRFAYGIKQHAKIIIKKSIPISAGLGGASSDAAATLIGLNEFWNLKLSQKELITLAEKLGADVPFFIAAYFSNEKPFTALGSHFGEQITKLKALKCVNFELEPFENWPKLPGKINPKYKTGEMYESLNIKKCGKNRKKTKLLLEAIEKEDREGIVKNLHNDFETLYPDLRGHHISGSGPTVFRGL